MNRMYDINGFDFNYYFIFNKHIDEKFFAGIIPFIKERDFHLVLNKYVS